MSSPFLPPLFQFLQEMSDALPTLAVASPSGALLLLTLVENALDLILIPSWNGVLMSGLLDRTNTELLDSEWAHAPIHGVDKRPTRIACF
ncbi:hypothetical protein HYPSUDRAFT_201442 [Hypholoma sublateritium FD-334 SS-4]|uniref:Uncharacterized protein n=1 Tax=Hypholoma sublateritium (strain FD-334 SS-4) TaxID=945553 RepID=A0A0D2PV26_HYPSF|nr:hypothetical protein HYPSUDRAFT_201442 [Hypholoma sublateritium FD-334 SS-4]